MIDDDEEYDEDDEDEDEDFGETELDRNAGDYGGPGVTPQEEDDEDDAPATIAVDAFVPPVAAGPDREDELPKTAPLVQPPRAIAKTAPLLPAQQPPGWAPNDADEAVTALDREVIDPARPPRSMPAGARDQVAPHPRQPAPPLPVPSSDLGLKLALAGLVALIVLLVVVLAVGILSSSSDAEQDDAHEEVRP